MEVDCLNCASRNECWLTTDSAGNWHYPCGRVIKQEQDFEVCNSEVEE